MHEIKIALHIHTLYSDGNASHQELVKIAAEANLDGIITTDHNILVQGLDGYYGEGNSRTLLLVGEEVHDRNLDPPGNHLLVFGAGQEMSPYAADPQHLIDQVNRRDGLSFLAHPDENALERFGERKYPWRRWDVQGFTGIELWNQMSEFKSVSTDLMSALINALFPKRMSLGPLERTLSLWDELITSRKRRIVAVGGVDAHQIIKKIGPFRIQLYPYLHHFQSVTTHIFIPEPLSGQHFKDRALILEALRQGHCFVAYDLPARTDGFRFSAHSDEGQFIMGDHVKVKNGLTFQIRLPQKSPTRLFRNGMLIKEWNDREVCTYLTTDPGVYRVESYIPYKGKLRGWIFSNPIYAWD
jgi:hypothetical protein